MVVDNKVIFSEDQGFDIEVLMEKYHEKERDKEKRHKRKVKKDQYEVDSEDKYTKDLND